MHKTVVGTTKKAVEIRTRKFSTASNKIFI